MASPFDRLMETVRQYLPGATDMSIKQNMFGVCQDFFQESNVWQESLDFTINAGEETAEVMPYTGKIERLLWVTKDGIPITSATMPDTTTGTILIPHAEAGAYKAQVALNVSDPVSRDVFPIVPYPIVNDYWQVMMHGLIATMMAMPNKPYTNLGLAAIYQTKFQGATARARNTTKELNTYDAQTWRFPQSFNRARRNGR